MNLWDFICKNLDASKGIMLLYVLMSEGSSPGRQGFKMAVTSDGDFFGTIGGGIMEQKSVVKAREMLANSESSILLMHQYHDKEHAFRQSGMICSGSQLNAFIPLIPADKILMGKIAEAARNNHGQTIHISPGGISLSEDAANGFIYNDENEWNYTEQLHQPPVLHIFGGGHVGLALSEVMNFLGYHVKIYDDRAELNTLQQNVFAKEKHVIIYEQLDERLQIREDDCVVLMTTGYRTDKLLLKQLLGKKVFYLGLLGSDHKVETLFRELREEGISNDILKSVFAPIGISIFSRTAKEIAVSIAAEIIKERNKHLPTGRFRA